MNAAELKAIKLGMTRILDKIAEGQFWTDPQILSAVSGGAVGVEQAKRMISAFSGDVQAAKDVHDSLLPGQTVALTYAGQNMAQEWMADTLRTALDQMMTVAATYDDIIELDRYDGPTLFLSKKIPGSEGRQYQAIIINQTEEHAIYAAVLMEDTAEAEAIKFTEDYGSPENAVMMARFRAQFEGKDAITFGWGRDGFTFMDAGIFPEDMLPGWPAKAENESALTM